MDEPVSAELRDEGAETEPSPDQTSSEEHTGASVELTADGCEAFSCQDCDEVFKEKSSYLQHCLQHQPDNADLDNHTDGLPNVESDRNTPHHCALCSLSFVKQSDFDLHIKTHDAAFPNQSSGQKSKKISRQPIHVCPDCGKAYKLLGLLRNHERTHRPPPKTYFSDLDLLKKKSFQCEICERSYTRASALDAHLRCHEENLIKPKTRSPGDERQTAARAKEEVKPGENQPADPATYVDCACGKSFLSLSRLKTHQRFSRKCQCSPEKVKPKPKKTPDGFECRECQRTFSNKVASYNHQRWHANQANASANKFSCEECGKEFQSLSFFYKHQRTAHSGETPAKSFLHQVCQLQKKAIECEVCGLRFSRPSALHSHRLLHANAFKDEEKDTVFHNSLSPEKMSKFVKNKRDGIPTSMVQSDNLDFTTMAEETHVGETEDDMEAYELSDFNVQVISASESEDEPIRDLNPDLELLCESDQEGKDEGEIDSSLGLNNMDLKIVQIDFEAPDEPCAPMSTDAVEKRFDCSECGGWYSSISSLRIHRRWHDAQKRRQQTEGQSAPANTFDKSDASPYITHYSSIKAHNDQNSNYVTLPAEGSEKKRLVCNECDQVFSRLSVLIAHQLHHSQRKDLHTYMHTSGLSNHTKTCSVQKKENILTMKKDYNPKKTLLGPKTYYCEQCGKGFWSLGAYSHHMQSETECTDLRLRKGFTGSMISANRHTRSAVKVACPVCGKKFRHKRMMALHMRKHENGNHKCELCNRSFRLMSSLLRHQVVHSDQLLPPPVKSFQHQMEQLKKNTYSCPDCGKLFSRAKALQFHMKSHGYETGYAPSSVQSTTVLEDLQCTTCFALFNSKASLRTHQKLCIKRKRQQVKVEESAQNVNALKQHENNIALSMQEKLDQGRVHTEVNYELGSKEQEMVSGIKSTVELKNMGEKSFSVSATINFHRLHDEGHNFKQNADVPYSQMCQPTNQEEEKGLFTCLECGRGFLSNWALSSHKRWHKKKCFFSSLEAVQDLTQTINDENEKIESPEPSGQQKDEASDDTIGNLSQQLDKNNSGPVKPKYYTCSTCLMTFAKARGLHAHNWQVHSMDKESTKEVSSMIKTECRFSDRDVNDTESQAFETAPATVKHVPVDEQKSKVEPSGKPFSCFDCGKECSCPGSLPDNEKLCLAVEQHSELDCQTTEASTEVSPPLSHVSDITDKCFFKCKKCGKAFPTEEQLGTHKDKAKSRPFSCALCCHSFWTKNQLQQHLAWHDQVRCRLPNEVRYRLSATVSSRPLISSPSAYDNRAASLPSSTTSQLISQSASTSQSSLHCGKAFLSPAALQRHNTQLGSTVMYSCPFCPTTFNEIQELIVHHQECVGGDKKHAVVLATVPSECTNEFTCYECGTTFCQETDLHQHCCDHAHQAHYT